MKPAQKALWYIENHLGDDFDVDQLASSVGVSRFHLGRAFSSAFGLSLMRYVRRRKLAEAAIRLRQSGTRILDEAIDAGYGSHEAFSRAFSAEFGLSPESYRSRAPVDDVHLQEAFAMQSAPTITLATPQILDHGPIHLVGMNRRYNDETSALIPRQWGQFADLGLSHDIGFGTDDTFGVLHNGDDFGNVDYFCGLEVRDYSDAPAKLDRLTIPAQLYCAFSHPGHVSEIKRVWSGIWNEWLPESDFDAVVGPAFERYGKDFSPSTGRGGFEVWVPVRRKSSRGEPVD